MVLRPLNPHQMPTEKEILEQIETCRGLIDSDFPQEYIDNDYSYIAGEIAALEWVLGISWNLQKGTFLHKR